MAFRTTLAADAGPQFRIKFTADDTLNSLVIMQNGVVVATDSNVDDETYRLPSGSYLASITFWGPVGTAGKLEVQTATSTKSRSAKIRQGTVRETISIGFVL